MASKQASESIQSLLVDYKGRKGVLLEVLHRVQETFGYISEEAVVTIASYLNVTPARIYEVMTFYSDFRKTPPPQNVIGLCHGPACHLRGATRLTRSLENKLGVRRGQVTADSKMELRVEQCPGICHLAPFMRVNEAIFANVRVEDLENLLKDSKLL